MVSAVSGRPGGGGTLLRNAVKMAAGSNGTRTAGEAFDLTITLDESGGTSVLRASDCEGRGGAWAGGRFERDRRERERVIRTMADGVLDGDRSVADGAKGWEEERERTGDGRRVAGPRPTGI